MRVCGIRRAVVIAGALGVVMAAAACGDVKDPIVFNPTPITYLETFTGTLTTGGVNVHPFINSVSGKVTLTLVTVSPDPAQILGFDVGTWEETGCQPIFGSGSRNATQGYTFAGSAIAANFCARVFDSDNRIPEGTEVSYVFTVEHR